MKYILFSIREAKIWQISLLFFMIILFTFLALQIDSQTLGHLLRLNTNMEGYVSSKIWTYLFRSGIMPTFYALSIFYIFFGKKYFLLRKISYAILSLAFVGVILFLLCPNLHNVFYDVAEGLVISIFLYFSIFFFYFCFHDMMY